MMNGVAIDWDSKKQEKVAEHSNGAEIRALYHGVKKTIIIRNFLKTIGYPCKTPTTTYEDNSATISQVLKDRITPKARPVDILVTNLHDLYLQEVFEIKSCKTNYMLADINSKPLGGDSLHNKVLWIIGHRYFPKIGSRHYRLLELDKYSIAEVYMSS